LFFNHDFHFINELLLFGNTFPNELLLSYYIFPDELELKIVVKTHRMIVSIFLALFFMRATFSAKTAIGIKKETAFQSPF